MSSFDRVEVGWSCSCLYKLWGLFSLRDLRYEILQKFMLLGSELLDNVRKKVLDRFSLRFSTNNESVILNGGISWILDEVPSGFLKWRMVLSSLKKLISSTDRGWAPTFLTMFLTTLSFPAYIINVVLWSCSQPWLFFFGNLFLRFWHLQLYHEAFRCWL